jgi:ribosomal protein L7/L12
MSQEINALHQRISQLEAMVQYLFQQLNVPPPPFAQMGTQMGAPMGAPMGMPMEIVITARTNKIEAIKMHREMFGSSLAEAKAAIDAL